MYKNIKKNKIRSLFISSFIIITVVFFIFFSLEKLARYKFDSFLKGSCPHLKITGEFDFYIPPKNCKYVFKHWEHNKEIVYETDEISNRKSTLPIDSSKSIIKIAFFGDSFTWGDMNSSDENYTHHASSELRKLKKLNVGYDNYGVKGYNLLDVVGRMKQVNLKNYDYIVYGLTPNDIFSPQILSFKKKNLKELSYLDTLKKNFKTNNLVSVKIATKLFFEFFPEFYTNFYTSRDSDLSGYLSNYSSSYWDKRYSELLMELGKLDASIRDKLVVQVIAQRVQVELYKKGNKEKAFAFDDRIKKICNILKIKYNSSQLDELSLLKKSHYTIDGHFNSQANLIVGKRLAKFISNW